MFKLNKILILVFLGLLIVDIVNAAEISLDKDDLIFSNVRRNGYAFNSLTITSDSPEDFRVNYILTGSLKDFITISSDRNLLVSREAPLTLNIEVRPGNIANGIYQGSIIFSFERLGGAKISNEENSFVIDYKVEVTDKLIKQAIVKSLNIDDINIGNSIKLSVLVENQGNIEISPILRLRFNDLGKEYSLNTNEIVLPGREKLINFELGSYELNLGNNNLDVYVLLGNILLRQENLDFYIFDKDESIRKIILRRIKNENKVHVNDDLEIKAFLDNKNIDTLVRFKAKIYLDNEFITNVESEEVLSENGKEMEITAKFKPFRTGFYTIRGYLDYGNRKSQEIESVFEAVPETQNLKEVPLSSNPILAVLLMLIAIFVVYRINRKKKR